MNLTFGCYRIIFQCHKKKNQSSGLKNIVLYWANVKMYNNFEVLNTMINDKAF